VPGYRSLFSCGVLGHTVTSVSDLGKSLHEVRQDPSPRSGSGRSGIRGLFGPLQGPTKTAIFLFTASVLSFTMQPSLTT